MALIKENYVDFGPTLAAEKLAEHHGFKVSRETLRKWMVEDGLWTCTLDNSEAPYRGGEAFDTGGM